MKKQKFFRIFSYSNFLHYGTVRLHGAKQFGDVEKWISMEKMIPAKFSILFNFSTFQLCNFSTFCGFFLKFLTVRTSPNCLIKVLESRKVEKLKSIKVKKLKNIENFAEIIFSIEIHFSTSPNCFAPWRMSHPNFKIYPMVATIGVVCIFLIKKFFENKKIKILNEMPNWMLLFNFSTFLLFCFSTFCT